MHGCAASARTIAIACRTKIAQILETLPRGVLEQTYRTMRARGVASGYTTDTQKLVAARLARIAVESNDAALARWLLDVSGDERDADRRRRRARARRARRRAVVASRSSPARPSGCLLPTRTRELRDEAADVVRGVSWALDLPRRAGAAEGVRLVTRDDGIDDAGTRAAMEELAGEGASVIVAGFDRASADRASLVERAERRPGAAPRGAERGAHAEDLPPSCSASASSASSRCSARRSFATA